MKRKKFQNDVKVEKIDETHTPLKINPLKRKSSHSDHSSSSKRRICTSKTITWPEDSNLFQRGERKFYNKVMIGKNEFQINDCIELIDLCSSTAGNCVAKIVSLYSVQNTATFDHKDFVVCQFYFHLSEIERSEAKEEVSTTRELLLSNNFDVFPLDFVSKKVIVKEFLEIESTDWKDCYYSTRKHEFNKK